MFQGIDTCIFDMDGTLLDSMGMWGQIDIDFMSSRGIPLPSHLQQDIEGLSMVQTAEYFIRRFHLEDSKHELMREWNDMARDEYLNHINMKPHAADFLTHLKDAGFKIAIATSNSGELVRASFVRHRLDRWVDACVTADEVHEGKPAPDVYLQAAADLRSPASNCLVFEDIIPGIQAGHNAGMRVVAVDDSYSHEIALAKEQEADWFVRDYEQADRILMDELKDHRKTTGALSDSRPES